MFTVLALVAGVLIGWQVPQPEIAKDLIAKAKAKLGL